MATTTITEILAAVNALQSRTDSGGTPVTDINGEEVRLPAALAVPGVLFANHWKVEPGGGMTVDVGSGNEKTDIAIVTGQADGQGRYIVRLDDANPKNLTIAASDLTNDRIDAVYLTVYDDDYDTSGVTVARLAVRTGDPAANPVEPGPDPAWQAWLKLATILVPAGATVINTGDIFPFADRIRWRGEVAQDDVIDLAATLTGKSDVGHDHLLDPVAQHTHTADATTSGEFNPARIPEADGTNRGSVKISDSVTFDSDATNGWAATPKAVKTVGDRVATLEGKGRYTWSGAPAADRTITTSTSAPTGGENGDIWLQY